MVYQWFLLKINVNYVKHPPRVRRGSETVKLAFWRRKQDSSGFFAHKGKKIPNFGKISLTPVKSTLFSTQWCKEHPCTPNTAKVMSNYVKSWIPVIASCHRFSVRPHFSEGQNEKCKDNGTCKILSSFTSYNFYLPICTLSMTFRSSPVSTRTYVVVWGGATRRRRSHARAQGFLHRRAETLFQQNIWNTLISVFSKLSAYLCLRPYHAVNCQSVNYFTSVILLINLVR